MSDWTAVQVKEHIEALFREKEAALKLLDATLSERLTHLNDLRGNVLTRTEYSIAHKTVMDALERHEAWQNKAIGVGAVLILCSGLFGSLVGALTSALVSHFVQR